MSDNLQLLANLKPQPLWRYFAEICSIPHCSKKEEQIRDWLKQQAQALDLPWREDKAGNIVISRPAAAGLENAPGIILQSHMDTELYREFTILLATQFKDRQLHGAGKDFVDRCIRLLKKVRFTGEEEQC